ncbi:MAG: N-acetyltransferase [Parafilimonas sp.]|nr:N-acetyltransferase [Parafilimonas sp.]
MNFLIDEFWAFIPSKLVYLHIYRKIYNVENINITNNEQQQQFEVKKDNQLAILVYRFHKNDIALMHTEVPKALEGKGIASALAKHAFEWAKEHNKKVMVYCPFVAVYLKRHPEYNKLVDKINSENN